MLPNGSQQLVAIRDYLQCHVDGLGPVHVEEGLPDAQQDEGHQQMVLQWT